MQSLADEINGPVFEPIYKDNVFILDTNHKFKIKNKDSTYWHCINTSFLRYILDASMDKSDPLYLFHKDNRYEKERCLLLYI